MANLTITNEILYKEMQKINTSQARGEEKLVGIEEHLGKINGNVHSHCQSIKELQKEQIINDVELKPIKKLYSKLTDFSIGIIIAIGVVAVGIIYLLKDKL